MSVESSPGNGHTEPEQAEPNLLRQITADQEAIQGLSQALMPLLVANLERLAQTKRSSDGGYLPVDGEPQGHA